MQTIIIATIKEWNIKNYFALKEKYKKEFHFELVTNHEELTLEYVQQLNPKYIIFPHWSWIIPKEIYKNYECIVFHMTDLPYGRGGSPLQNLITNQIYDTKISALKVSDGLDSGDIYLKTDFNIEFGSATEIFEKASTITFNELIPMFFHKTITPKPQEGEITTFKRRTPEQSNLNTTESISIKTLYDFIRMLDAEGYPKAFFALEKFNIELSDVQLKDNTLSGKFEVKENEK